VKAECQKVRTALTREQFEALANDAHRQSLAAFAERVKDRPTWEEFLDWLRAGRPCTLLELEARKRREREADELRATVT
jgi:hypothetical protein